LAASEKTLTGYYVKVTPEIKKSYNEGKLTFQSYTSTLAVLAMGEVAGRKVLDLCAAPGGKSLFLAERGATVTACEIHPHRAELIKAYAKRMKVGLDVKVCDGINPPKEFWGAYDAALVDAPCSGLGVLGKKKDIALNRKGGDIKELAEIQNKLLSAAAKCVKAGGVLVYSTCTILKEENGLVVKRFLDENKDFEPEEIPLPYNNKGELQFLPDGKGTDGFYIARMRKKIC
jgi:16S rRNA (cytosine967-C5)-methyltransferase